jgi:hypothetical protein
MVQRYEYAGPVYWCYMGEGELDRQGQLPHLQFNQLLDVSWTTLENDIPHDLQDVYIIIARRYK